jgi:hypothetical protein
MFFVPCAVCRAQVVRGELGNHQDNPSDLSLITTTMQHRAVANKYLGMHETQTITCTATSGSFLMSLSSGSETRYITVNAADTPAALQTSLNGVLLGALACGGRS